MAALERDEREGVPPLWRSPLLRTHGFIHGFSTRLGGVSAAPFDSLDLTSVTAAGDGARADGICENERRFAQACGTERHRLARIRQIHGATVVDAAAMAVAAGTGRTGSSGDADHAVEGDAVISSDPEVAALVRVADCLPLLVACPRSGIVAAVHAGWRGLVGGVIEAGVGALVERGAAANELLVAIGPGIAVEAFEVGPEIAAAFIERGLGDSVRRPVGAPRPHIDLESAAAAILERLGVPRARIDRAGLCTHRNERDFFSHRRDGAASGRMAAVIAPQLP